jgi:hypothetical protein
MHYFFRHKTVWFPTVLTSLLLCAAVVLALLMLIKQSYPWLALNAPARGKDDTGASTLIVEGWLDESELAQVVAALHNRHYQRVLTTGGPIAAWSDVGGWKTFAARSAAYLSPRTSLPVIALPAPESSQERTYLNGLMVRAWQQQSGTRLEAVDVYSAGAHARRSRMVYRMALNMRSEQQTEVGVLAAIAPGFDAQHWWRSSIGVKTTLGEALSWAWTACCFWPAPPPIPTSPQNQPN